MSQKRALTGIKPTGELHLGNYLGAIAPGIELSESGGFDAYYFIADYHSLITVHDRQKLNDYSYEVAASWLAMGLSPERATLYRQSDIPEITELAWILNCFTAKGLMNRAHAYKAALQDNQEHKRDADFGINMGLYSYPVLMAADILFIEADIVPVGQDQLQHIEICRDIAQVFNHHYGETIKLPRSKVREDQALVPGLDGRKMSKSYQNSIPLFLTEKKLKKTINRITTDSTPPEAPKDPKNSLIFDLFSLFASAEQTSELKKQYLAGISWGEAKAQLFELLNEKLKGPREEYQRLMSNKAEIDHILSEGAQKVRPLSQETLSKVKKAIGVRA